LLSTPKSVHSKSNIGTGGILPERLFESKWNAAAVVNENIAGGIVPRRLCDCKSKPSVVRVVSAVQFSKSHSNKYVFVQVPSEYEHVKGHSTPHVAEKSALQAVGQCVATKLIAVHTCNEDTMLQILSGTTPSKADMLPNFNNVNDTRLPIAVGNAPLSCESWRSRSTKAVKEQRMGGIVPVKVLLYRDSISKSVKLPIADGMVPENLFSASRSLVNSDKLPSDDGRVDVN